MDFSLLLKSALVQRPHALHQVLRAFQTRGFLGECACGAPCRRRRRTLRADRFSRPFPQSRNPFPHCDCNSGRGRPHLPAAKELVVLHIKCSSRGKPPTSLRDSFPSKTPTKARSRLSFLSFHSWRPSYSQILGRPAPYAFLPRPRLRAASQTLGGARGAQCPKGLRGSGGRTPALVFLVWGPPNSYIKPTQPRYLPPETNPTHILEKKSHNPTKAKADRTGKKVGRGRSLPL